MARHRGKDVARVGETFNHNDLEEAAKAQGCTIDAHDNLVIRTGWLRVFYEHGAEEFYGDTFVEPGLTYSPELVEWFHDREIASLSTDTIANEVTSHAESGVVLPLHAALMRNLGVLFTEICWLDELAESCAADDRWTFFYAAAPLNIVGGTGGAGEPGGDQVSAYAERVWLAEYDDGKDPDIEREYDSALAMWQATAERAPRPPADPLLRRDAERRRRRPAERRARGRAARATASAPATGWPSTCRTCRSS